MRVVIDYRPALRERSGVGEYTHQLVRALTRRFAPGGTARALELTVFSSSWKDRLALAPGLGGVAAVDRRVPVSVLNLAWHRLEWPTIEALTGRSFDVTHSLHPLLLPSRTAAHVVTIHDLNFLTHPERTRAEIRRDYPALARAHAHRADRILVPSAFTAREVEHRLGVPAGKITVCPPGAPEWAPRDEAPKDGYILFFGTLEPRKNLGGLLDAYERLLTLGRSVPPLVVAGKAAPGSRAWLDRMAAPPFAGLVRHIGYVDPADRRALYAAARLLVQPSFEEGFGIPVLEAMSLGVPVVAADRGALPEVLGDAGLLADPEDPDALASAIARMIEDDGFAAASAARGLQRAGSFNWDRTAELAYESYRTAIEHRRCASA